MAEGTIAGLEVWVFVVRGLGIGRFGVWAIWEFRGLLGDLGDLGFGFGGGGRGRGLGVASSWKAPETSIQRVTFRTWLVFL